MLKRLTGVSGLGSSGSPQLSVIHLPQLPIYQQLLFEESLYRFSQNASNAWLIFNDYTQQAMQPHKTQPQRNICNNSNKIFHGVQRSNSIVLGCSSRQPAAMVNKQAAERDKVQMIRRFTGGGTVLISPSSLFLVSMILPRAFFGSRAFPTDVMNWSGRLYKNIFPPWNGRSFNCRQNDYTIESDDGLYQRKVAGNAQAMGRSFIVHHTSFIWEADHHAISRYLLLPKKQPEYREQRRHEDFICGFNCNKFGFGGRFENVAAAVIEEISDAVIREFALKGLKAQILEWEDVCEDAAKLVEKFNENSFANLRATWEIGFDGEPVTTESCDAADEKRRRNGEEGRMADATLRSREESSRIGGDGNSDYNYIEQE